MSELISFLNTNVFSLVMVTIGENDITLGQTIAGALVIYLGLSVFKRIKV